MARRRGTERGGNTMRQFILLGLLLLVCGGQPGCGRAWPMAESGGAGWVGRVWWRPKRRAGLIQRVGRGPVSHRMSQGQGRRYARVPRQRPRNTTPQQATPLTTSLRRCISALLGTLLTTLPSTLPYRAGTLRDERRALQCASSWHALVVLTAPSWSACETAHPSGWTSVSVVAVFAAQGPPLRNMGRLNPPQPAACRPLLSEPTEPTESTHYRPA
jgi:hypothetical protein